VLSITRHRVPADRADQFTEQASTALDVLRRLPGFVHGAVGRATDDGELWLLTTTWDDVGSFRRALSSYDVKVGVVPLLATALDEPTAFERLVVADDEGTRRRVSDRAPDADWAGPARG
jgi:heme-degrading monooxygenase HmoA